MLFRTLVIWLLHVLPVGMLLGLTGWSLSGSWHAGAAWAVLLGLTLGTLMGITLFLRLD